MLKKVDFFLFLIPMYAAQLSWGFSNRFCSGTCRPSHWVYCFLLFSSRTETDEFEAGHACLVQAVAANWPNSVLAFFVRQVPRCSSFRKAHLRLLMVEISSPPMRLPSPSGTQYQAREQTLLPACLLPPGADWYGGGTGDVGGWSWHRCRLACLSGCRAEQVVAESGPPPKRPLTMFWMFSPTSITLTCYLFFIIWFI